MGSVAAAAARREDRQARQPRCIFEVRCRRCARSPWPAAGSEAGSRSAKWGDEVGHHLRVRPHFPPGHAFRGADSRRAGHPVRLQHPGAARPTRQPSTRGHRLRQPQGEPDYGSRVRQPWTVWLGLHLPRGHGRTCPHRPGFRLGDSRRQGYRVRVRSDCGSGLAKITVEQLKGAFRTSTPTHSRTSWPARTFRPAPPHCSTPPQPSWPTAIWSATAHWPSVSPKLQAGRGNRRFRQGRSLFDKWIETAKSKA